MGKATMVFVVTLVTALHAAQGSAAFVTGQPQPTVDEAVDWVFPDDNENVTYATVEFPALEIEALTTCFWFNTTILNKYHVHLDWGVTTPKKLRIASFSVGENDIMTTSELYIHIGGMERNFSVSKALHDGVWHHICSSWDGVKGDLNVYLDGELQSISKTYSPNVTTLSSVGLLFIGREVSSGILSGNVRRFTGQMSRINLWNNALSKSVIERMSTTCYDGEQGSKISWSRLIKEATLRNVLVRNSTCPIAKGRDCMDLLNKGYKSDGFYLISPNNKSFFSVGCDQQTNGGGWTVFQRRMDGSVDFHRIWNEYKIGFGNPNGEFWLGNNRIKRIVSTYHQLLIELRDLTKDTAYDLYDVTIKDEADKYELVVYNYYEGTAGKTLYNIKSLRFSTYDRDNDHNAGYNYAMHFRGGFWISHSNYNLNAEYVLDTRWHKIRWHYWKHSKEPIVYTEMKLRPIRERNANYGLSFDGEQSSSYVFYSKVKGFKNVTVCAWLKIPSSEKTHCLFSMFNNDQRFQLCFSDNSKQITVYLINSQKAILLDEAAFSGSHWTSFCFARQSQYGKWKLRIRDKEVGSGYNFEKDKKFEDGSLVIGQKVDNQISGIDEGSSFIGDLTRFSMWPSFVGDQMMSSYAGGCMDDYGAIPWPEAHLWIHGSIRKYDVYLCKSFKVDHTWNLDRNGAKVFQDVSRGTNNALVKHEDTFNVSTDLNVFSSDEKGCIDLTGNNFHCLSDPSKCLAGFTLSFWLKQGENLISRILEERTEQRKQLEEMLSPVVGNWSKWSLCYRASKHGWDPKTFHLNCDSRNTTLTIVKVKDYVFGGFIDHSWGGVSPNMRSDSAFLFSLSNPIGCPPFKLKIKPNFTAKAAQSNSYSGPVFGLNDLYLGDVFLSDLGQAYDLPDISCIGSSNGSDTRGRARRLLAGSYYFVPDEIEVFEYVVPTFPKYILSAGGQSCGVSFSYNEKREHQFKVSIRDREYTLTVPDLNTSKWTRITVTWSEKKGLRLRQDNVTISSYSVLKYKGAVNCPASYTFALGCAAWATESDMANSVNFQLTGLQLYDTNFTQKEMERHFDWKTDIFRPAETFNAARAAEIKSFLNAYSYDMRIRSGHRERTSFHSCFWHNANIVPDPWWEINLGQKYIVTDVFVVRGNQVYYELYNLKISVLDGQNTTNCSDGIYEIGWRRHGRFYCDNHPVGQKVKVSFRVKTTSLTAYLRLCEIEVRGFLFPGYWLINSSYPKYKGEKVYYRTDFVLSVRNCLTFHYVINGTDAGRLNVYSGGYLGKKTLIWRLAGDQGHNQNIDHSWKKAQVPISEETAFQVIIEAIVGKEYGGFIALDNITLSTSSSCSFYPMHASNEMSAIMSNMIQHIPSYKDWLLSAVSQAGYSNQLWVPCYHALNDGWNTSVFHIKCLGKGPLIVILRSGSQIFGGFSDVSNNGFLDSTSQNYAKGRPTAQKNTKQNRESNLAVDGNAKTFAQTERTQDPWWRVEMEYPIFVYKLTIYNRHEKCCQDNLHDFEIIIGNQIKDTSYAKCGGFHSLKDITSKTIYCKPAIYGKFVTIQLRRNVALYLGEVKVYGFRRPLPSTKAFLYTLSPKSKLNVRPDKAPAIIFTKTGMRFGVYDLTLMVSDKKVFNSLGDLYEALPDGKWLAGSFEFYLDDIEVLMVGDSLCDPPCLKGERCDEVLKKCVCDFGRRDYELCLERRDIQDKRDKFCRNLKSSEYYARYDRINNVTSDKRWRCYSKDALTDGRMRYNATKLSNKYESRHSELMAIQSEYPNLNHDTMVHHLSNFYWPLDHPNDLKDLNNDQWSSTLYGGQYVRGVMDGALMVNGTGDAIKFPFGSNIQDCLFHPRVCSKGIAISLWIKYYFTNKNGGKQVFLSTLFNWQDRGFVIYQINGSFPHIAVSVIHANARCTRVVEVPRGIWTHLALVYYYRNDHDIPDIYVNGARNATVVLEGCKDGNYGSVTNDYFTIGQSDAGAPNASLDDIVMILDSEMYLNSLTDVYNYYKGGENLFLNASFVLTKESWSDDLLNKESDGYQKLMTSLLKNISDANIKGTIKNQEIKFWKKEGESVESLTGCNILIGFHGRGYSQMEDVLAFLEQATDMISDLTFSSNDVYLHAPQPVEESIYGSTMKVRFQWKLKDKELSHGILQKYVLFYVNGEDPSDKSQVDVVQDDLGNSTTYNLTVKKYFSRYVVSVRADTLEGEGRVSKGVNITTGSLAPIGPPQTVQGWNLSSTSITVSWTDIDEIHLRGPISGYNISIHVADRPGITWQDEKSQPISQNRSVVFDGLYKYTNHSVRVAGVIQDGQIGPYSQTVFIWTGEDVPEMAPSNPSAQVVDSTSVIINWSEIPLYKRNGIIIGYIILWTEKNTEDDQAGNISVPAMPLSYTLTGLKYFTLYKVKVAGFTVIGGGPYSVGADVRTGEDIPGASPNITEVYNASSTSLNVIWQPIPVDKANGILLGYVLRVNKEDGTFVKQVYHNDSTKTSYRTNGLSKYQTYQIKVAVFNSKGRGNFSLPVLATTDEDVPEAPPQNVSPQNIEQTAVNLAWQPPSSEKTNGILLGYLITLRDRLRGTISHKKVNTSTQLRIDGLHLYTDYSIIIRAFTRKGNGTAMVEITIKTEQGAPSGSPTNVRVQPNLSSSSSITVSWGPVDKFKVNGDVTSYVLIIFEILNPESTRRNFTISVQSSSRKKRSVSSGTTSTELTGLQPFTQYGIQILAVTIVNGVPSPIYNVTTSEDVPSHPPLNLTAHNTSSTSIKVTWNEIPKEHRNGIILGYKIRYENDNGFATKTVMNETVRHTELTGLEKYKLYSIRILGFTVKGSGNLSAPVSVRTAEDVPDGVPVNVSSVNPTLTTLTIQWKTMPVHLENGIIRGYEVALFEMDGTSKANVIINGGNSNLSTVFSGLEFWSNYTVRVRGFTSVGPGPWSLRIRVTTDEQAPQDTPCNVTAHALSSTSIRVSWQPIDPTLTRGLARGYRVYYRALDTPFSKPLLNHTVGKMETSADLTSLYKYVEYSIYVVAVTNKEGNASAVVVARTDEDKPDRPPSSLAYNLPDPTSIWLSWDEVREGYKNGIILGYKMTYRDTTKSDPPTPLSFLPEQFSTTLRGLDSYIVHEISLLAFTVKGDGPAVTHHIRTDENTPYMSPGNFTAESYTSTNTLPVNWEPIPPHGLPGILLGYRLYYIPVSTGDYDIEDGETNEIRIPADKTQFVLTGLDIFTRYRVEISGYTIKGDGPLTVTFGETCRCQKRLSSSWLHFPPYVNDLGNDSIPEGIIPPIAQQMVIHCCQNCKAHGKSHLDLKRNGYSMSAREKHLETLKIQIDGMTDMIFPIAGYRTQEVYKMPYGFISLVGMPGVAFVLVNTSTEGMMGHTMAASIWTNWTLLLFSLSFAFITGCFIWFLECRKNEDEFPKSFSKGSMEGFWFTFVSMTTVGYGDRCPLSVAGRIITIAWTLFGVVLIGMLVGNIATSMTIVAVNEGGSLYGLKAGALKNSFEYRFGIRRNAKMNKEREYESFDEIYEDLVNHRIRGALLDSFALGSRSDLFEKPFVRIKSIYDINLANGIVTAGNSIKLNRCLRRFTRSNAKKISDAIKDNARAVEVEKEPLASELSSGIFDANSPLFKKITIALCALLCVFAVIGIIWEMFYLKHFVFSSSDPDASRLQFLKATRKELGITTKQFICRVPVVMKRLQEKHRQELQQIIYNRAKQMKYVTEAHQEVSGDGGKALVKRPSHL